MSSPHDFDFFHGEWEVLNRRRTDFLDPDSPWEEFPATSRCRPLFDGAANIDEIDMPRLEAKGATLRLFDRDTGQWSLNWAASRSGKLFPPVVGGFGNGRGEFHGDDTYDGKDVRVRFVGRHVRGRGPLGAGVLRRRRGDLGDQLDHGLQPAFGTTGH